MEITSETNTLQEQIPNKAPTESKKPTEKRNLKQVIRTLGRRLRIGNRNPDQKVSIEPPTNEISPKISDEKTSPEQTAEAPEQTLESFLEEKIFKELSISEDKEQQRIAELEASGASEKQIAIEKRSFANIRETIRLYFHSLTEEGIHDYEKIMQHKDKRHIEIRDEFIIKGIAENPLLKKFKDLKTLEEAESKWNELKQEREDVEEMLGIDTFTSDEDYQTITSNDPEYKKINEDMILLKGIIEKVTLWKEVNEPDSEIYKADEENDQLIKDELTESRVKITREEALEALKIAIIEIELHNKVTLNLHLGALEEIIESGAIVSSASLDLERLEDLAKAIASTTTNSGDRRYGSVASAQGYMRLRAEVEEQLDLEPGTIIYGAISTDDEPLGHTMYGECCVVFNKDALQGLTFTEADSMSVIRGDGFYGRKSSGIDLGETRRQRQLSYDHALISQAVTRAFHAKERELLDGYDSDESAEYLEAQIPTPISFDREHILEIKIDKSVDMEKLNGLDIPIKVIEDYPARIPDYIREIK